MTVLSFAVWTLVLLLAQSIRAKELAIRDERCNEFEDAFNPTQLPYPGDCTKFYKCSFGYAFPLNCQQGLHWSVALNRCEWPNVARCSSEKIPTLAPATPAPATPAPATLAPATPAPATPAPATPGPATPAPATPAPATPAPATPAPATPAPATPAPATPAPATPAPATPTTAPPKIDVSNLDSFCKSKAGQSRYFSYPGDCKRFIQCSNGRGYVQTCPGTLLFNSQVKTCALTCV